jgi:hypothetical protein
MREEVFLPLNMTHTSVHLASGLKKYQAVRYSSDGLPIPFYDFDHPGASAVFSSAHDLIRFGMFHLKTHLSDQKTIISDETIDEMQQPTADISNGNGYGIGWRINENEMGYRSVRHSGGMGGVSTILALIPAEKLTVVTLANSSSSIPDLISKEILSVMLPKYAQNRARIEAKRAQEEDKAQEAAPGFKPVPELIGKWLGSVYTYKGEISITCCFKKSGDIHVQLGNQLKTLLNDVTFKDGYLSGRMMGDIGTEDANRHPYHLHITLKLRSQTLNGAMTAISLPGPWLGNALSHWVELRKEKNKNS